jgi:UDP-glucose 4-epimerase
MLIGGSGFIGSRFSRHLLGKGIQPVVVDWVHPSVEGVEYHPAELRTITDLTPALLESVEAVFCLAWTTKPQAANQSPAYDLESNVLAGLHFLDGVLCLNKRPKIIFVSSGGAVYGVPELHPTPETAPPRPIGAYGISKLVFEHYLELYSRQHGLEYLVLRPANPYGEGQNPDGSQGAVGVFLGRVARNEPIHIWGDGTVTRDYFYIADLADAMMRVLDYKPGLNGERIFNLGSGRGVSLNQLLDAISSVTGIRPDVRYQPGRGFDVPSIVLDCARADARLGWRASTPLETGLAHTWKWIKTNGAQR